MEGGSVGIESLCLLRIGSSLWPDCFSAEKSSGRREYFSITVAENACGYLF